MGSDRVNGFRELMRTNQLESSVVATGTIGKNLKHGDLCSDLVWFTILHLYT